MEKNKPNYAILISSHEHVPVSCIPIQFPIQSSNLSIKVCKTY